MRRVDGQIHLTAKDWSRLFPSTFENLCADMVRAFGFQNVQPLAGPGDKGRDILCERTIEMAPGISTRFSSRLTVKMHFHHRGWLNQP